jgi:plasmid maintenance system antidote protein VapI
MEEDFDTSTKSELAEELRCTKQMVSKLINNGLPVRGDGKVNVRTPCGGSCAMWPRLGTAAEFTARLNIGLHVLIGHGGRRSSLKG